MNMKKTLWKKTGALLLSLCVLFSALPSIDAEASGGPITTDLPSDVQGIPSAPNDSGEDKDVQVCHHDFVWVEVQGATTTSSGVEQYQCKYCDLVKTTLENSGYGVFAQEVCDSISDANLNAKVTASTTMWESYPKSVFDALEQRSDVSLTTNYKFEGKLYTTTIPSNADLSGLVDENGYCGFRQLDAKFGGSEIITPDLDSSYEAFVESVADAINNAEQGANVTIETSRWLSFPGHIISFLTFKSYVSLTINYQFEGKYYTVTIPAGTDSLTLLELRDENDSYDFRKLYDEYDGSEIVK